MSKLIESETTETLPSGTTITTLYLTPEVKRGLSTNGARIPASVTPESSELTVDDHKMRLQWIGAAIYMGTVAAVILALAGVPASVCAMIPSGVFGILTILWSSRDLQAIKRRQLARQAESAQTEVLK